MKALIVLAHPDPRSLNASLATHARQVLEEAGHEVKVSDLYAMKFKAIVDGEDFLEYKDLGDERMNIFKESLRAFQNGSQSQDVADEQAKMQWYGVPAILKGWFDRVWAGGFGYWVGRRTPTRYYDRFGEGAMAGKRAICMLTCGGPAEHYSARGIAGPIDALLWPINHGVLFYIGYDVLPPFVTYHTFPGAIDEERYAQALEGMKERLLSLMTAAPIPYRKQNDGDYTMHDLQLKPGLEEEGEAGFDIHIRK